MKEKMYKRGDIVRITSSVQKLIDTQGAPELFAHAVAGKEVMVLCSYPDRSYDLEGTRLKLDNSVLEYVGHPPRNRGKRRVFITHDPATAEGDRGATLTVSVKGDKIRVENIQYDEENTNEWKPFTGDYVKRFYDVRLPSGEIVHTCYPNAGKMNATTESEKE